MRKTNRYEGVLVNKDPIHPILRIYWAKQNWQVKRYDGYQWIRIRWSDPSWQRKMAYTTGNGTIRCWLHFLPAGNMNNDEDGGWRDQDEAVKLLRMKAFL